MQWLFLLLALAAMALAFVTTSSTVLGLSLLAALVLFGLWIFSRYSARVSSQEQDMTLLVDPAELRRLREIAEARKAAAGDANPAP